MNTRTEIIRIADDLIRKKGYNAFSFSDISKELNIKNASIHYHFPSKTSLGKAIIQKHITGLEQLKSNMEGKDPLEKLEAFLSIYTAAKSENKICIVGSLATDLYTFEPEIQNELKILVNEVLQWVMEILAEGKQKGIFHYKIDERAKAMMIITNMLAAVQLTRLTDLSDFKNIQQNVINDLIQ